MTEEFNKTIKRTVKLTVRVYDGEDREPSEFYPDEYQDDDPFASFSFPIEDVEDAVLRFVEEREGELIDDDAELVTTGTFTFDGREVNITFFDPFEEGDEPSPTVINWRADDPGIVSVIKSDEFGTVLVLEEGKTNVSVFETALGPIEARVFARKVVNKISKITGKGEMYLDYLVSGRTSLPLRSVMTVRSE